MPVYKDEKNNTWYCRFYLTSWDGTRKQVKKRGFKTKKAAQQWEAEEKTLANHQMHISMEKFVEIYFRDKAGELKERTISNKRYMITSHILPYFSACNMDEIKPADIIQWQNTLREKNYADTYLRMIQNQMTALFSHASNIYGLKDNPCRRVKKMGKPDADEVNFWTKEEYDKFIGTFDKRDWYYVLFETLFWTGCRIGEALALCIDDIDLVNNQIRINKTYYRAKKQDVITEPKTQNSVRIVDIPDFLAKEIQGYIQTLYKYPRNVRIFQVGAEAVQHKMKRHIEKAGVKKIRVHDLRHSHVSFLINQGVDALLIKQRLGHRDITITLNTYGHLYPNEQKRLAEMLNERK